jgi:hypothetical protein
MGYGDVLYYSYDLNSSYHSMQVVANRRFVKSVSGGLAWTWSKAMDYADNDTTNVSTLVSPKIANYGLAGFDRTHILKGNWIWNVPKGSRLWSNPVTKFALDGWQVSGIVTILSGAPQAVSLSLSSGNANNWSGSPTDAARVDLVGNPVLPKDQRTFEVNVNTAAFALPNQGSLGNSAKSVYRGPGRNNWDISMFKTFRITERFRAQFRCESYNTFNHTQFSTIDNTAKFDVKTSALMPTTFGQFTAAQLARRMQLALRITF